MDSRLQTDALLFRAIETFVAVHPGGNKYSGGWSYGELLDRFGGWLGGAFKLLGLSRGGTDGRDVPMVGMLFG